MKNNKFITAGIFLGIGLGGFLDGIVFHQLLQTHSMLSAHLPQDEVVNIKTSMIWDGLFHLLTWVLTVVGLAVLWNAVRLGVPVISNPAMVGTLLTGWGLFNFTEGVTDHYILQVHHVVERMGLSMYDHLYVSSGLLFALIGSSLMKRAQARKVIGTRVVFH